MVLTTSLTSSKAPPRGVSTTIVPDFPPQRGTVVKRGTTLPSKLSVDSLATAASTADVAGSVDKGFLAKSVIKAQTLPSTLNENHNNNNNKNNNNAKNKTLLDTPMVSRNAPASVSIVSLPSSDNEALNFDNG